MECLAYQRVQLPWRAEDPAASLLNAGALRARKTQTKGKEEDLVPVPITQSSWKFASYSCEDKAFTVVASAKVVSTQLEPIAMSQRPSYNVSKSWVAVLVGRRSEVGCALLLAEACLLLSIRTRYRESYRTFMWKAQQLAVHLRRNDKSKESLNFSIWDSY